MNTLLIYYSENEQIRELCEQSRSGNVDTYEIREYFDRSPAYVATIGSFLSLAGKNTAIEKEKPDLDRYDTIIIASPVWALNPAPAVNSFLRSTNLKGKEIIGLLFNSGLSAAVANDVLRKRISLAGGACKGVVSIPKKELLNESENVLNLAMKNVYAYG